MKKYESLGQLTTPPLVYSMGMVLINLKNIKSYIDTIQDVLRDEYPGFSSMEITVSKQNPIQPNKIEEETIPHFILNNPDATWGIVFSPQRIVFHTTDYKHFADFGKRFEDVLIKFQQATNLKFHAGIAFRQIDNIKLAVGEKTLKDCINAKHLVVDLFESDIETKFLRQEYRFKLKKGNVISRIYTFENEAGPRIPQDLFPQCLALNQAIIDGAIDAPYVLADLEANYLLEGRSESFHPNEIITSLDKLHQYASMAFRDIILPDALKRRR